MQSFQLKALHVIPFALLALAAQAVGCSDPEVVARLAELSEGCLIDSDCNDDLVCVFRRCHFECETTKDCRERDVETICALGDKPTHVCLLPDEQECEVVDDGEGNLVYDSSTCVADMRCARDGKCRDACQSDGDCLGDQQCLKGTCADPENEGLTEDSELLNDDKGGQTAACRYNSECLEPLICRFGVCEVECQSTRDCRDDETCLNVADVPDVSFELEGDDINLCVADEPPAMGPDHCDDGVVSGNESAVDCGGDCLPCPSGTACDQPSDCVSGVCESDTCANPTCDDGVRNGIEVGVDCGGICDDGCPPGTECSSNTDCNAPATCDLSAGLCIAPSCTDNVLNDLETDIDCGGPDCAPCPTAGACVTPGDCASLVCAGYQCIPASCSDGVQNGDETDVDCGGPVPGCARCGVGADCLVGTDCGTGSCQSDLCAVPACDDGVKNGFEFGVDCGGGCPNGCPLNDPCNVDADCDATNQAAGCHPVSKQCLELFTVTVNLLGGGEGGVTSTSGIYCGVDCSVELFAGDEITLTATPNASSTFAGFGSSTNDCFGPGPDCTWTMGQGDVTVDATFDPGPPADPGSVDWLGWVKTETADYDMFHVAADPFGHLVWAGYFADGAQFNDPSLGGGPYFTTSPTNSYDALIAKVEPGRAFSTGALHFGIVDGGNNNYTGIETNPGDVVVGPSGNIFVAYAVGPENVNPVIANTTVNCGAAGIIFVSYNPAGALRWLRCVTSNGTDTTVGGMEIHDSGLIAAGFFNGSAFDIGTTVPLDAGPGDAWWVARLDPATGNLIGQDAKVFATGSGTNKRVVRAALSKDGATSTDGTTFYAAGWCRHGDTFGSMQMDNAQGAGSIDGCVLAVDVATLTEQWVWGMGAPSFSDTVNGVDTLSNGDVVVGLNFRGNATLATGTVNSLDQDSLLVRIDGASGEEVEHNHFQTTARDIINSVLVDDNDVIYINARTLATTGMDLGGGTLPGYHQVGAFTDVSTHSWSVGSGTGTLQGTSVGGSLALMPDGRIATTVRTGGSLRWVNHLGQASPDATQQGVIALTVFNP